jgi:exosome complex component RRP46
MGPGGSDMVRFYCSRLVLLCGLTVPGPVAALASFTGPIEVRLREEKISESTLEVVHRPLEGVGGTSSRALETVLHDVFTSVLNLSSVPRSLCQLVVQSLTPVPVDTPCAVDADAAPTWPPAQFAPAETRIRTAGQAAAARAAAINAAALAALHAGSIGLRAVPVAIALARHDGAWIVDPTTEEEEASDARAVFAWAFGAGMAAAKEEMTDDESPEGEVVWVAAEGAFSRDEVSC